MGFPWDSLLKLLLIGGGSIAALFLLIAGFIVLVEKINDNPDYK